MAPMEEEGRRDGVLLHEVDVPPRERAGRELEAPALRRGTVRELLRVSKPVGSGAK